MTVQAGVVGWPIAHSLSPLIHNTWIAAAGLDAAYVAHGPETPDQFAALLDQGRAGRPRRSGMIGICMRSVGPIMRIGGCMTC